MIGQYGYAGKILRIDLSSPKLTDVPTSDYTDRFLGGRGIASKVYWDEVSPQVGALDPENRLIIVTGPVGAQHGLAGSLFQVHAKSPYIIGGDQYCLSNSAGFWGARLKLAGYDALIIHGAADKPMYLLIQDGKAELRDASHLWGKGAVTTREMLKAELGSSTHVLAIGPAGENQVTCANILSEGDSSAGNGFGAVMGSKKLKAIAVIGSKRPSVARPEVLKELVAHIRQMDEGSDGVPPTVKYAPLNGVKEKPYACYGCISHCWRNLAETSDGVKSKRVCQSGNFYQVAALGHYGEYNEVILQAGRLCNEAGLDSMGVDRMIKWMTRSYAAGTLTEENTDIPLSKKGSLEYIETLTHKMAHREGFGDILAQGAEKCVEYVGGSVEDFMGGYLPGQEGRGRALIMDPRTYIYTGVIYAMDPRDRGVAGEIGGNVIKWLGWVHKMAPAEDFHVGDPNPLNVGIVIRDVEELKAAIETHYVSGKVIREAARRFWGGELAVDFSTYEGKALAAKKVVDRTYAKECLVLCGNKWPMTTVSHSENHVGDPTLESQVVSAVTGKDFGEEGLHQMGERVFNLFRAIRAREGHAGREHDKLPDTCFTTPIFTNSANPDCLAPGPNGMLTSLRGQMLDRQKFQKVMDEYYQLQGWDVATGLQTKEKLSELGLGDVVPELEKRGLVV